MMPTNNIDIVCTGDLLGHLGIWLVQVIKFLIVIGVPNKILSAHLRENPLLQHFY